MEKGMKKADIKKAFESVLQYGWMWGKPKSIEDWDLLYQYYKEELNDGKDFEPDVTKKATARTY
tara:strand:+ start:2471 stop:2662 length:192 start_codon:yes stop_codon:yes gene_type:complete